MWRVGGWLPERDALLMAAICTSQSELRVRGDILEIGAYLGKASILLGFCVGPGERLHVCDVFDSDARLGTEGSSDHYPDLTRAAFERNFRGFHDGLPVIHHSPSADLDAKNLPALRFIHIDGAHSLAGVRTDIDLAMAALGAGGVVVFDDVRSLHAPGVSAAFWEAVAVGRLELLATTKVKAYACRPGDAASRRSIESAVDREPGLRSQLRTAMGPGLDEIIVVGPKYRLSVLPSLTSVVGLWRTIRALVRRFARPAPRRSSGAGL